MTVVGRTAGITDEMVADQFLWYDPERIILFGSHARGEPAADIDVAIIKETADRFLDRLKHVYERWSLPIAVDILVYTPAEWDRIVEEERGFILRILQEGREIYVRHPREIPQRPSRRNPLRNLHGAGSLRSG